MIAPSDAAVAARSFPRRWRALFARAAGDGEHTDVLTRSGAEALAAQATDVLARTADALPAAHRSAPAGAGLDRLEAAALHLATVIESIHGDTWTTTLTDTLSDGIDTAAALLRQAERAIADALAA